MHYFNIYKRMNDCDDHKRVPQYVDLVFIKCGELKNDNIRLYTNYPITDELFYRDKYYEIKFNNTNKEAILNINKHGTYQFYFTDYNNETIGRGYFYVEPNFILKTKNNQIIEYNVDCLTIQTYLAKNLGYFNDWLPRLNDAIIAKYNMIHFTPMQQLGISNSAYSIMNQLEPNPDFTEPGSNPVTWDDIKSFTDMLRDEYGILSMTDLVLNHTANNSKWIHEHPECGYNTFNSPHLKPAYLLDRLVFKLNKDISENKYANRGLPNTIYHENHLNILRQIFWEHLDELKIAELYLAHIDNQVDKFKQYLSHIDINALNNNLRTNYIGLIHGDYRRLQTTVCFETCAVQFYKFGGCDIENACIMLRDKLSDLNRYKYDEIQNHLSGAIESVLSSARWNFVNESGPKYAQVSCDTPICLFYFYQAKSDIIELEECEKLIDNDEEGNLAYNGWVGSSDPCANFALEHSNVYLRRELNVWGDCIKLRYGSCYVDSPYLWNHICEYVKQSAIIFDGVRLDNCHSIEREAAQFFLDEARRINPNLYVMAELFSGSSNMDNLFINMLGIDTLVRETCYANNVNDMINCINYHASGLPIGSLIPLDSCNEIKCGQPKAIIYDRSHDNRSAISSRSPFDILPTAALLSMARCTVGSTYGYDQMVPEHINVVSDLRMYRMDKRNFRDMGIVEARGCLNYLHQSLSLNKFDEIFTGMLSDDVVIITRGCRDNNRRVILVTKHSFNYPESHNPPHHGIQSLHVSGCVKTVLFEMWTRREADSVNDYRRNEDIINGLPGVWVEYQENILPEEALSIKFTEESLNKVRIDFVNFPVGSVVAFEVILTDNQNNSFDHMRDLLKETKFILDQLNNDELFELLYNSNNEQFGFYNLHGHGCLQYCGLAGFVNLLNEIRRNNDLGHSLCNNLRDGDWSMDYIVNRLCCSNKNELINVGEWINEMFSCVKQFPRYLIPKYFDLIVTTIHEYAKLLLDSRKA